MDAITDDDVQAQIDENLKDKAEPVSDAGKRRGSGDCKLYRH